MKLCFHYCCRGLKTDLIFADEREFIAGMNRIGVCYLYCIEKGLPVQIAAFCLMSNHFHFVLYGSEEATELFINHYVLLSGKWIQAHRGERLHGKLSIGHWPAQSTETIRNKVVYTLRQTLEAGIQLTPQGYPWCSARLMFFDSKETVKSCNAISNYSGREALKTFNTRLDLPNDWMVMSNGMIWPGCYTDWGAAQKLFSGVKDFMFCLNNGNIDKAVNSEMYIEKPAIPDTELRNRAISLVKGLFDKSGFGSCSAEERIQIANLLKKELHCGSKQLARIVMMDEEELRRRI